MVRINNNALVPQRGIAQAYMNKKKQKKDIANWAKTHPTSKMSNGVGWGGEPPMSQKAISKMHKKKQTFWSKATGGRMY